MARFRFKSRQVSDPLAQQNFEQLEDELNRNVSASSGALAPTSITSAGYATFTGAPSITIPRSGDYLVTVSGSGDAAAPEGTGQLFLSYAVNGGAATDATAIRWRSTNFQSNSRTFKVAGLKRGDVLAMQAKQVGASPGRVFEADITAIRA